MLTINNLNLQFGNKHLFKDISAAINEMERIGLIGVNGTGKSTLLKMLAGIIETDHGVISRSKRATIGYLPQEIDSFPPGRTIFQEAETAFAHLIQLQKGLEEVNHQLSSTDPQSSFFSDLLHQQGELQQQLDDSDFFQIQSKTETVLHGLGFKTADFDKDCNAFSGGWLMRLMLAKLLLMHPSFLFLDEPTNHLDIETLTWLEDFLKNYKGAFIIISHDRTFLDNLIDITWELSLGKLTAYRGNYSKYVQEKEIRMQVQRAAYANQQAKIQQTMRFVTRFRAKSTKAKQVQSRVKQLEKIDLIELEESEQKISFRFPPSAPSGRLAIAAQKVSKSYDGLHVFQDISFEFDRGDKVAVVGVNGAGKSTLAKILAGLINQDSGQVRSGHNVKISYFGQHQAQDLCKDLTVLQTMEQVNSDHTISGVRSLLGAFLFRGDDVDKKVMVLSGGEKSRLALAKMIATPANLLIMDEPTNHLDMMSQEVLQEALSQYDGSIIVVSHNRHFADSFVNKVLEVKNGKAVVYDGDIRYYLSKIRESQEKVSSDSRMNMPPVNINRDTPAETARKISGKEARQEKALLRQKRNQKLGPLKKNLASMESEIEVLETQKLELEQSLADPELYNDQDAFTEKSKLYNQVGHRLTRCYTAWEDIQSKIDKLEEELL
jgi:ATP-binding cassette subfamily F protein 3